MPFSVQRVEKLTGLRVEEWPPRSHRWVALNEDGTAYAAAEHLFSDDQARRELANTVYRMRCFEAMEKQEGLCGQCGRMAPLQGHHKKFRSHQGTHERSNIILVCVPCHNRAHGKG